MNTVPPRPPGPKDRRQSPRFACRGALMADLRRSGEFQPVADVSQHGFAVLTPAPLEPSTLHHCAFRADGGAPVPMLVQVARSEKIPGEPRYVTAFKFPYYEPGSRDRVAELVAAVAQKVTPRPAAG